LISVGASDVDAGGCGVVSSGAVSLSVLSVSMKTYMPRGMRKNKPSPPASSSPTRENTGQPAKSGIASRLAAFNALTDISGGRHLDEAMRHAGDLAQRDRAFVRLLVTTVLRRHGQIDRILGDIMSRRPAGRARDAIEVMRLGAAQLLFLETGAHAAVDSTVDLMRAAGFDSMTGLANAVMRRLSRDGAAMLAATGPQDNLPDWIRQSWQRDWGEDRTRRTMELAMMPPPLDITPARDHADWAARLEGVLVDGHTIRRDFDGDPTHLAGFDDGAWWVQDAAAALPARLFADLAGRRVIDLCAAPGGKTAQLIAAGAHVTAIDTSERRLRVLRRNLERLGMSAELVKIDGRRYRPDGKVDAVLIDAPCSATGTLRRRPDVPRHRTPADIDKLVKTQGELLATAAEWLAPGGCLIYATCSLQHEEGEAIIDAFLRRPDNQMIIDPVSATEAGAFSPAVTDTGTLRIVPADFTCIGGVDGFFIARLKSRHG